MPLTVIKLGGSLGTSPELPRWLTAIQRLAGAQPALIVPGGGRFANQIRRLQQAHDFADRTAHRLALLAMCRYAACLKQRCPALCHTGLIDPVELPAALAGAGQRPLLWRPLALLGQAPQGLRPDWAHTSDSIALWLAARLHAARLYVIKSIPPPAATTDYQRLAEADYIDQGFPRLARQYRGKVIFLAKNQPDCLAPAST